MVHGFRIANLADQVGPVSCLGHNAGDVAVGFQDIERRTGLHGDDSGDLQGAPLRALRAFTRVHVKAGKTEHSVFVLQPRDLSHVNEAGDRIIAAGAYRVSVGGGQPGTAAPVTEAPFSVQGEQKLPE